MSTEAITLTVLTGLPITLIVLIYVATLISIFKARGSWTLKTVFLLGLFLPGLGVLAWWFASSRDTDRGWVWDSDAKGSYRRERGLAAMLRRRREIGGKASLRERHAEQRREARMSRAGIR